MKEPTREQIQEAFKKTIERWEKIVENPEYYAKTECNLCLVHEGTIQCHKYCPIRLYDRKHAICHGTPFDDFQEYKDNAHEVALAELNFLRKVYIWWMEGEEKDVKGKEEKKVKCKGVGKARACGCKFLQEDGGCSFTEYCSSKLPEEKEELVDVTKNIKAKLHFFDDSTAIVRLYDGSYQFGYVEGKANICSDDKQKYKAEDVCFHFRILKKS